MNNGDKLKIIEEYEPLINKYVNMYYRSIRGNDVSREDLISEIKLGLLKDLDSLDEDKGKSVFIENSIKRTCAKYITSRNRYKRSNGMLDDSLDRKIVEDEESKNLIDMIESGYDLEYDTINNILVKEILEYVNKKFGSRDLLIINMYSYGYTFREIASYLNLSKQRVNYIYNKAINKIRDEFKIEVI